jgi:hypothetical protein
MTFLTLSPRGQKYKNAITMGVLFLINLLNYMDRFAIAGINKNKKSYETYLMYRCVGENSR